MRFTEDIEKLYVLEAQYSRAYEMPKRTIGQWFKISVPLELSVSDVRFIIFSLTDLRTLLFFLRDSCVQFPQCYVVHKINRSSVPEKPHA